MLLRITINPRRQSQRTDCFDFQTAVFWYNRIIWSTLNSRKWDNAVYGRKRTEN